MSDTKTTSTQPGTGYVRIYGCGGFGVNLASHFETTAGRTERGMAALYPVYLDTSRSNLKEVLNEDNLFLLPDTDGAGKDRRLIHSSVAPHIKSMLTKFEPMDLNIVCFSASGGSGSVIGPLLMAELAKRGAQVVGLVVGSGESVKAIENTVKTLQSLENLAERAAAGLVMVYEHNDDDTPEATVDGQMRHAVAALSVMASRQNNRLDSADIRHFLRFDKSTRVAPRLASMDIVRDNNALSLDAQYITMVSLYETTESPAITIRPEYHAAGYLPEALVKQGPPVFSGQPLFHFAVRIDEVALIYKTLNGQLEQMQRDLDARVVSGKIAHGADASTDDGLFL